MPVIGRGDHHRVDFSIVQYFAIIGVGIDAFTAFCKFRHLPVEYSRINLAQCPDSDIGYVAELFDVVGDMRREPLPFTLEELWRQALARRPDYQAALRDQARSVAEVRLQIAQGKVDYVIGAEYRRQQGLAGTGNSLGFFFSAPLPLFNRNQGEIARAGRERQSEPARQQPRSQ